MIWHILDNSLKCLVPRRCFPIFLLVFISMCLGAVANPAWLRSARERCILPFLKDVRSWLVNRTAVLQHWKRISFTYIWNHRRLNKGEDLNLHLLKNILLIFQCRLRLPVKHGIADYTYMWTYYKKKADNPWENLRKLVTDVYRWTHRDKTWLVLQNYQLRYTVY